MGRCFVALVLVAGCLSDPQYICEDDLQCVSGARSGVCTAQGYCAYPEESCESGLRYSKLAGGVLSGACVPAGSGAADSGDPPATTSGPDPEGCVPACDVQAGPCDVAASGECVIGSCIWDPQPAGTPCDEACEGAGFCDATGTCLCDNEPSGTTTGGDACETTCVDGPHSTAACDADGVCIVTCEAPWEDCDGDPATGCEVPVGLPDQCSMSGLDPEGCWTPFCGESMAANAHNFGTYHCLSCSTCQEIGSTCRWCEHEIGSWYPADRGCFCGEFLDLSCTPA